MNHSLRISSYLALLNILPACHSGQSSVTSPGKPADHEAQVRAVLSRPLPPLKRDRGKVTVLEVTYAPGGFSPPHRHPCPVIGYVVNGAIRTAVDEGRDAVIHAGEAFYEAPNGIHRVSANASDRVPVRFLAFFLCDNDQPLSVAEPSSK